MAAIVDAVTLGRALWDASIFGADDRVVRNRRGRLTGQRSNEYILEQEKAQDRSVKRSCCDYRSTGLILNPTCSARPGSFPWLHLLAQLHPTKAPPLTTTISNHDHRAGRTNEHSRRTITQTTELHHTFLQHRRLLSSSTLNASFHRSRSLKQATHNPHNHRPRRHYAKHASIDQLQSTARRTHKEHKIWPGALYQRAGGNSAGLYRRSSLIRARAAHGRRPSSTATDSGIFRYILDYLVVMSASPSPAA